MPSTASVTHFLVKLVLAAPASFFSAAFASQALAASVSQRFMKLVSAAPYIPPVYYPKPFLCEPGYFKRGTNCIRICPPGTYRNGNRCIYEEPAVLVCTGGKVPTQDGDCVCPAGAREVFNGYRTRCVWPEHIRCYGGRVVDGDCYCPEGTESVKSGRHSYLCMPIRDEVCIDGTWRGGRCDCPLNRYLVKIDRDTYQCVRRSKEPVCYGGFADEGRCSQGLRV